MMKLKLCQLGHFKHSIELPKLLKWKSKLFTITSCSSVLDIHVDHFQDEYTYPKRNIINDLGHVESGINLTIGIVNQPLEGNYYMHRLESNKAVISLFPVIDILKQYNIPVENYILRCIYEIVVFLYEGEGKINENVYQFSHHETRGCLFDMNVFINGIVDSCNHPILCLDCKAKLRQRPLPNNFIDTVEKELKKIKMPLFYRIESIIKKNPIISLIIASIFAVMLNIIANYIYDKLK